MKSPEEFQEFIDKMNSIKVIRVGLAAFLVYHLIDAYETNNTDKGALVLQEMHDYVRRGDNE